MILSRLGLPWIIFITLCLVCFALWLTRGHKKYPYEGIESVNQYFTNKHHNFNLAFQENHKEGPEYDKQSKGERITREIMERLFGRPFIKTRPKFLKNPMTGRRLELDGYNEEIALAFEYNGPHHYLPSNFLKTKFERAKQAFRDHEKPIQCDAAGVTLLVIPYWVDFSEIESYIMKILPIQKHQFLVKHGTATETKANQ